LIVHSAARMVIIAGRAGDEHDAERQVREALRSGAARNKLKQMIEWQGGDGGVVDDTSKLPSATLAHQLTAKQSGYMTAMDALLVGRAAVALGAGRDKKGDQVDLSAGILLHKKPGERVTAGEPILELRYNDAARLDAALHFVSQAVVVGDQPPPLAPLVMGWVHEHGETMYVGGM
jgi:pyrimidine-nucleoside phosphorylase